jgi:hypothetical protein
VSEEAPASDSVGPVDDLTRIAGIGSKIAHRLNMAGIRTYADLASRTASEISKVLSGSGLSSARLDVWRGQAQELAAAAAADVAGNSQRYTSFVVRLLINDGSIRSTTVECIGNHDVHRWPGWDPQALLDFIGTAVTSSRPSQPPAAEVPQSAMPPAEVAPRPAERLQPALASGTPLTASAGAPRPDVAQRRHAVSSVGLSAERTVLRAAERFTVTMSLDFSEAAVDADRIAYSAVVVAKPLTGGLKRTVARADGLLAVASSDIRVEADGLPPGVYRLTGVVSLREPGVGRTAGLAAMAEGLMVQVLAA